MRYLTMIALLFAARLAYSQADAPTELPTKIRMCIDPKAGKPCVVPPHAIYQPDPPYSKKAREKKLQGQVWLSIIVGTDGTTRDVKVSKSLGLGLDEEAVKAVQTWKFNPATLEGKPVAVQLEVSVGFHLL